MVMKSGAISKLMSKGISTTTIQAVVVIALLTMSFIAMYGVSVIFNYILSNVVASTIFRENFRQAVQSRGEPDRPYLQQRM